MNDNGLGLVEIILIVSAVIVIMSIIARTM